MPDIALYYPYTHVRDESWLKAAALYWPKLAVMVPPEYPRRLTETAMVLRDDLGFFVDVDPYGHARLVAEQFSEFVRRNSAELRQRYGYLYKSRSDWFPPWRLESRGSGLPSPDSPVDRFDVGGVGLIHVAKMSYVLLEGLVEHGLGALSRDDQWVAMHPRLADVYVTALAERVAEANHLPVVTDQPNAYGALNGWTLETLAQVLLSDDAASDRPSRPEVEEVAALYAAVAIGTTVPRGLEEVSVERVVRARRVLAAEFDAFRAHLDSLMDRFTEMAQIESPEVLRAQLQVLV